MQTISEWIDKGYVLMGVMVIMLLAPLIIILIGSIKGKPVTKCHNMKSKE